MQTAGRLSAAIDILADFDARRVPLKTAIADWGRANRYAGAKDRAWISGLCLDALRRRNSIAAAMGDDSPRALALGAFGFLWKTPTDDIAAIAAEEPHGPGALADEERFNLSAKASGASHEKSPLHIAGDFPEWLTPQVTRVFGDNAAEAMAAFACRADIDLRVNALKATPEKALAAMKSIKAEAAPVLETAARIAAPDPSEKAPGVTVIPAFNKGWVEVQDLGSQIAAAAAGDVKGRQVLDYCAGGGGKTLALAAMMENTGQIFAYDIDARRLKPLFHRARRAGVRNLQIRSPAENGDLADLAGKMDVVFLDAPCSGSGTWRRHPDAKWRFTDKQLQARIAEQAAVLDAGAAFVKPGGRLVWVTCSFLMEENEDVLAAFRRRAPGFEPVDALNAVAASGLLREGGRDALAACRTQDGALRITPDRLAADGFFVSVLKLA